MAEVNDLAKREGLVGVEQGTDPKHHCTVEDGFQRSCAIGEVVHVARAIEMRGRVREFGRDIARLILPQIDVVAAPMLGPVGHIIANTTKNETPKNGNTAGREREGKY